MRFLGLGLLFLFVFQLSTTAKAFVCFSPLHEKNVVSFESKKIKVILMLASEQTASAHCERCEMPIVDDEVEPIHVVSFFLLSPPAKLFPLHLDDFHLAPHLSRLFKPPEQA